MDLSRKLFTMPRNSLQDWKFGAERESHRIQPDGSLSTYPHPEKLAPPSYTKDFAETQLEMATGVHSEVEGVVEELVALTQGALDKMEGELLWPWSMPPALPPAAYIPVASFPDDEEGRRAAQYRRGLARRYGAERQMISGVHLNLSFGPAFLEAARSADLPALRGLRSDREANDSLYLAIAAALARGLWLIILLSGASPSGGPSFPVPGLPEGGVVSLRASSLGYAGGNYRRWYSLESLGAYLSGLRGGLEEVSEEFSRIPLVEGGRRIQLNSRTFQCAKEFYAPLRLKRFDAPGDSLGPSLAARGIGYLELRTLDLDPFGPAGLDPDIAELVRIIALSGALGGGTGMDDGELSAALDFADGAALAPLASLDPGHPLLARAEAELGRLATIEAAVGGRGAAEALAERTRDPSLLPSAKLARIIEEEGYMEAGTALAAATAGREHALRS